MDSDMDVPTETGSMSMDIDDGTVSSRHFHPSDSNSPGSSAGQTFSGFHPTDRRFAGFIQTATGQPSPDCGHLPSSDDSSQPLMQASPPFSMTHFERVGSIHGGRGLTKRHRNLSTSNLSAQDVAPRKRKRADDVTDTDDNDIPHDDILTDDPHPRSRRRRPRLRTRQDGEFTPLLIMSPATGSSAEEETISMFHYPPLTTGASYPNQQRHFIELPPEHAPGILPSRSLPTVDDPEEPARADSTSSFAAVALASTGTRPPGRLSTLQDFPLPRPFDESPTDHLALAPWASVHVHARGLDAPLSFLSLSGPRASRADQPPLDPRAPHDGARLGLVLEPPSGMTVFLDKPLCDSPDEIDPSDEDAALAIRGARVSA